MNYIEDDQEIRDVGDVKDEDLALVETRPLPLKPWEHYTIADDLLREAREVLAPADPRFAPNPGRAQMLADLARAHSEQAAAGALLQQHYAARFTELWAPHRIVATSKEERDAELDAYPGTAKPVDR